MRLQIVAPHKRLITSDPSARHDPLRNAGIDSAHPDGARQEPAREILDVFIARANGTEPGTRTPEGFVLRDLALAIVDLARRAHGKATVRLYEEPWEFCIERFGPAACLSVYRAGPDPTIAVYDRAVTFDGLVGSVRDAIDALLADHQTKLGMRLELTAAADQLRGISASAPTDETRLPEPVVVVVEPDRDSPISFGAEFALRPSTDYRDSISSLAGRPESVAGDATEPLERSDMHALLFRGRVRAEIRGRSVDLGECHPVLLAERLVELARRAFDSWERGLPFHARGEAAGVVIAVRVSSDGELALTLGPVPGSARRPVYTFPALGVTDVLEASLAFGRSLARAILRRDRSQASNLRLGALRRALRDVGDALRQVSHTESKINARPEPYRAFAAAVETARPALPPAPPATRLRYAVRWRALVPGLDLRATYLCGDRLIASAATEMWALDRTDGRSLWRTDVTRGMSVVTPGGIVRLAPDGTLSVHDLANGERTFRTRIAPRVGGPVAGAVVHLSGLPRLVVVTEGAHHLVAIDLTTGELRWRTSWGSVRSATRRAPRMKRSGRLVYFSCGDGAMTALDVASGAVVWRLRDRLRFGAPLTVAHDSLFVVAGGAHGVARLYCIDPYSGKVRWSVVIADPSAPCTVEGAPMVAASGVAVAIRQKTGLHLAAFRREDGQRITHSPAVVAPLGTSWLAVDDSFIGNAPTGELVAVDARTGELSWRHLLGPRPLEADVPRRLEPVLRCGALFVPCSLVTPAGVPQAKAIRGHDDSGGGGVAGVCILRPSDGTLIGTIAPTDVIPDLLRVDEQCDVYVAEESGHLAAFGSLPRLSLVPAS